jgi:hypothetical protein
VRGVIQLALYNILCTTLYALVLTKYIARLEHMLKVSGYEVRLYVAESLELQLAFSSELRVSIVISSLMSIIFAELVRFTVPHHGEVQANFAGRLAFFRRP